MSISLDLSAPDQQEVISCNLLPCKIENNGTCNVEKYFNPFVRDQDNILSCSLRGHPLLGQKIKIPDGYKGVVLKEKKLFSEENRQFKKIGNFKEFTYWNWDKTPSNDDKIIKAMQWVNVASALHKPVSAYEDFETQTFKTGIKRKQSDS